MVAGPRRRSTRLCDVCRYSGVATARCGSKAVSLGRVNGHEMLASWLFYVVGCLTKHTEFSGFLAESYSEFEVSRQLKQLPKTISSSHLSRPSWHAVFSHVVVVSKFLVLLQKRNGADKKQIKWPSLRQAVKPRSACGGMGTSKLRSSKKCSRPKRLNERLRLRRRAIRDAPHTVPRNSRSHTEFVARPGCRLLVSTPDPVPASHGLPY